MNTGFHRVQSFRVHRTQVTPSTVHAVIYERGLELLAWSSGTASLATQTVAPNT
jgi:diaminopimelate epimerase